MSVMIPDLEGYFRQFAPPREDLLLELEQEAAAEGIPIVGPVVGRLLYLLGRAVQARTILELGTATGYSTIFLARSVPAPGGRVVTLERDQTLARRAAVNFQRAGLEAQVDLQVGEAAILLPALVGPFDLIFMDIDKEGYLEALPHCRRLLRGGGLLVADNVAFQGAAPFNRAIWESPDWCAVPLLCHLPGHSPERDGLCLALRLE
ncbi:MAG: methyltransferase domain-containing protein [Deltaproteobacteria bacterium]|nr:methyltransferase domain-containing protein [Deltaproteobacteria bacterium]